jgi:hypothetical protein
LPRPRAPHARPGTRSGDGSIPEHRVAPGPSPDVFIEGKGGLVKHPGKTGSAADC